jgi:hypothetical protein
MSDAQQVTLPNANADSLSLAERLDPAIGEATSVVGAMLTELLRRTLRGGVVRIGDEMHEHVSQKVDSIIAERTPAIEHLASTVAEHAARTAATEVATEEVRALEQRTRDGDRELSARIDAAAQTAQHDTAQTVENLTAQIQQAESRGRAALAETAQTVQQQTTETAGALTAQIQSTELLARSAQEEARKFAERAREGSALFKAKLGELQNTASSLGTRLDVVRQELDELTRANEALTARVIELEKPRGLRALFAWLFGRRRSSPSKASTTSEKARVKARHVKGAS